MPGARQWTDDDVAARPAAALEYAADRLTGAQFDAAVAATSPRTVLRMVAERLSAEQFDAAVARHPSAALVYASDLLSDEQYRWCTVTVAYHMAMEPFPATVPTVPPADTAAPRRRRPAGYSKHLATHPRSALAHADQLTEAQFAEAAEADPASALRFAAWRLTVEQFNAAIAADPAAALLYVPDRLSVMRRKWCLDLVTRAAGAAHDPPGR